MLAKLKVECGYQFTHKLEGMFHDMKISDDTMSSYRTYLENTTVGISYSFLHVIVILMFAVYSLPTYRSRSL